MKLLLYFICSFYACSQAQITIVDHATKEPVPYVNFAVVNKNIKFSADENGNFSLPATDQSDILKLSAVGYADAAIKVADIGDTIYLQQKNIELAELVVSSSKNLKSLTIKPARKAKKRWYGAGGGLNGSLLHALYLPYKPEYSATPYLKSLKLKFRTDKANTFNIRLYTVNTDGSPGGYLYDENILVAVKAKQSSVKVDLSKYSFQMPQNGMFVVVEYLAIRSNRLGPVEGEDKFPAHQYGYGPLSYREFSDTKGGWNYKDGKWSEYEKTDLGYAKMVMELTLTD